MDPVKRPVAALFLMVLATSGSPIAGAFSLAGLQASVAEDAAQSGDDTARPGGVDTPAVVLESGEAPYSGEPITLSLKDADIKDVLKTFATLTGHNIVVDPTVSGAVTLELREVPWDQAFELVLTLHDLGYELLGNVLYVAPRSKLMRMPLYRRW
jgi:type II secretory pathway component GspD/PulD (secretin)